MYDMSISTETVNTLDGVVTINFLRTRWYSIADSRFYTVWSYSTSNGAEGNKHLTKAECRSWARKAAKAKAIEDRNPPYGASVILVTQAGIISSVPQHDDINTLRVFLGANFVGTITGQPATGYVVRDTEGTSIDTTEYLNYGAQTLVTYAARYAA